MKYLKNSNKAMTTTAIAIKIFKRKAKLLAQTIYVEINTFFQKSSFLNSFRALKIRADISKSCVESLVVI